MLSTIEIGDTGYQAAHIFPLAYEQYWVDNAYSRWIAVPATSGGSTNSVQNGTLFRSNIRELFDSYQTSIDPDDNYKIVCFGPGGEGIAGEHLDCNFLKTRVDQSTSYSAGTSGAGEPIFECDLPPGSEWVR
ncbi:MAG: hypothetical protein M1839_004449 [Geoglossum umbratile]|nr:MAG: hypothetical protein M1839_004449 [Geoglossum umbratile]